MRLTKARVRRAALILSIIGLGLIHVAHSYIEPQETAVGDIEKAWIGNSVEVSGKVSEFERRSSVSVITVDDGTGSIKAVDFSGENFTEGKKIEVRGYVEVYHGQLELVAEEITRSSRQQS